MSTQQRVTMVAEQNNGRLLKVRRSTTATYCYLGPTPEGKTAQIDLVVPATTERTDYLCEMKYSEGKYAITTEYEENLTEKLEALRNSSAHKRTHSILLVLVTTFGLTTSKHNGHVNVEVTLNELFG